jgi:G6PDH family F420-dependent oxidoreductase
MPRIGYALSSEEHRPADLVRYARRAEQAGFTFALISDHFHPWIDRQGQSAFVWSVIGAIAQATERLTLGTGVTCPLLRIHPAIIAQAAATSAALMPGRFFLGLGTGENLNEHILADRWPAIDVRQRMLIESIELIRKLWSGDLVSFSGEYYIVENARIYTLPDELPPIVVAASGPESAELAGGYADGLISTTPDTQLMAKFQAAGGGYKPRYGQIACCWAPDRDSALRTAHEWWPTSALTGPLGQELALPSHFEKAAEMVTPEMVAEQTVLGPDPSPYLEKIQEYADAGYDHVYIHQIGPDQDGFFGFAEKSLLTEFG